MIFSNDIYKITVAALIHISDMSVTFTDILAVGIFAQYFMHTVTRVVFASLTSIPDGYSLRGNDSKLITIIHYDQLDYYKGL